MDKLLQIEAPFFTAGLTVANNGMIYHAAPIIRFVEGWTEAGFMRYADKRGWKVKEVVNVEAG